MDVSVGTCGYDYPEWVGADRFYPPSLAGHRFDWLTYYASQFPLVELNFTYYGETSPRQMEQILRRVEPRRKLVLLEGEYSPREDFRFTIKGYAALTHRIDREWRDQARRFREDIAPLIESDRLRGVLAQFPSRFRFTQQTSTYVARLAEELAPLQLIVEFRHPGWYADRTYRLLTERGIVVVGVDVPDEARLPRALESTELSGSGAAVSSDKASARSLPFAYYRLHGRREDSWWAGDAASRYEYHYSPWQLAQFARKLMSSTAPRTYVLFNNHRHADAAKNARQLGEIVTQLLSDRKAHRQTGSQSSELSPN